MFFYSLLIDLECAWHHSTLYTCIDVFHWSCYRFKRQAWILKVVDLVATLSAFVWTTAEENTLLDASRSGECSDKRRYAIVIRPFSVQNSQDC